MTLVCIEMPRARAIHIGAASILCVIALQLFNSFACYEHNIGQALGALAFVAVPMARALVSLALPNPLRAVGACLGLAPWLALAYVTDCVLPYSGGGASMIYVAVVLWGTPCAVIGALLAGPITRRFGIEVHAH
jgi:hypothetical protein